MAKAIYHNLDGFPKPMSPSSHAVEANGFVYLTGQFGRNLQNPAAALPEGIEAQTVATLQNLKTVLTALDLGLEDIVSVRVFLTEFKRDYDGMNAVYGSYFTGEARPARTCVGVTELVRDALIEIDCVAVR